MDTYNGPSPYDAFISHVDYATICDVREKGREVVAAKDGWKLLAENAANWGYFGCTVSTHKYLWKDMH